MKPATLLLICTAIALPMCAHSKKHRGPARSAEDYAAAFRRKDNNHDGILSRDEYTAKARNDGKSTRTFVKKDQNGDGKLTKQEFSTTITRNW